MRNTLSEGSNQSLQGLQFSVCSLLVNVGRDLGGKEKKTKKKNKHANGKQMNKCKVVIISMRKHLKTFFQRRIFHFACLPSAHLLQCSRYGLYHSAAMPESFRENIKIRTEDQKLKKNLSFFLILNQFSAVRYDFFLFSTSIFVAEYNTED